MIDAADFNDPALRHGFEFWTGVPCSILTPLINVAIEDPRLTYVTASSEGEAVAIAAGASLAGRGTVVACQNSGLGNMVNPLTSLNFPFRIPSLLIVTHRGEPGVADEPQHEQMGSITARLLELLAIPWEPFPTERDGIERTLERASEAIHGKHRPYALLMKQGSVSKAPPPEARPGMVGPIPPVRGVFSAPPERWILRGEAVSIIKGALGDDFALIATTGRIGRELFETGHRPSQFYVVGSMGCASGIGLGLRLGSAGRKPARPIAVLDGDGAALMKLGAMATIGHYRPERFLHVILDNEQYESTGGQSTSSSTVDFATVAAGCGFANCFRIDTASDLAACLEEHRGASSPTLLHLKVASGSDPHLKRPDLAPVQVKTEFAKWWNS